MIKFWTTKSPAALSLVAFSFAFLARLSAGFVVVCSAQAAKTHNDHTPPDQTYAPVHTDHTPPVKTNAPTPSGGTPSAGGWHRGRPPPNQPPPPPPAQLFSPGRSRPPPQRVGPTTPRPRPVKRAEPVGVSNPNKTNTGTSGPVILLRKNDSGGQGHGH